MSVIHGLNNVPHSEKGRAVAIGVFDGVHWGHKAIFESLRAAADESGLDALALTFEKHPTELLAPTRAPLYINTLDQRVELMKAAGIDEIVVAEFSPDLANLPKQGFMTSVLRDRLQCKRLVVGSNFRFGRNREGDTRFLHEAAPALGIGVTVVPAVIVNGGPVSSTRIRAMIARGDVEASSRLLGRRFALRGVVVQGRQIGRSIGFPTANIQTGPRQLIPGRGVYAVEVKVAKTVYPGVCSIGTRPTFDGRSVTVEVHLPGFEGNLYGECLDVVFCRRLRDEMKFESPQHLVEQIEQDIRDAAGSCGDGRSV